MVGLARSKASDTATAGPRDDQHGLRHGRPVCKGERCAREGLAAGGLCRNTNGCIMKGTWLGRWVMSRYGHDTARGSPTIPRRKLRYVQQREEGGRGGGGGFIVTRRARTTWTGVRCDTTGKAYDTATTRPATSHDMAGHRPTTRPAWAQCARPVHTAWARVCTWCTQPSFHSVHSS